MNRLSQRLKLLASYIADNQTVVDIGCDHALLDVFLATTRKNLTIIASDINQNALDQAIANIKKYRVQHIVKPVLSDGLKNIAVEADVIVLAGLGSYKIVQILKEGRQKIKETATIIVQSNSNLFYLRKEIVKLGYYLDEEQVIKENNIYYNIIVFKQGKRYYRKKQLFLGIITPSQASREKNEKEQKKLQLLLKIIPKKNVIRRFKVNQMLKMYKQCQLDIK